MCAVVAICLGLFSSRGFAAEPYTTSEMLLSLKISDSPLSPRAKQLLRTRIRTDKFPNDLTIEDVVRTKRGYVNRTLESEIAQFLSRFGLRRGLTLHEIEFYRSNGRLPKREEGMSGDTDVSSLQLPPRALNTLLERGVEKLSDHRKISIEELLLSRTLGPVAVQEVKETFKRLGYPLYKTRTERVCHQELEPDDESDQK